MNTTELKLHQEKVLVDFSLLDSGIVKILLPIFLLGFIFMTIYNRYSIFDIFIILVCYLAILLLLLQNRSIIEHTHSKIIIRRFLFRPIVIQKNEIIKTQVIKNFAHTTRWIFRLIALIILPIMIAHNINAIHLNIEQSLSMLITVANVLSIPLITVMFVIIFYNFEIRTHYPYSFNVITNKRTVTFYIDNPEEFSKTL